MKRYVIGVDGGGTKTHYALFEASGNLVNFVKGGPANHECMVDSYEGTRRELEKSINTLLQPAGLCPGDICCGVFGLAGVDVKKQHEEISCIISEIGVKKFKLFNDAFLGIKAGSTRGYGVCSISGTGTCCTGIDRKGHWLQIGGMGFIFGGCAGSGYLGSLVIKRVYDSIFRCGQQTIMKDMLFKELDIIEEDDLVKVFYSMGYPGSIRLDKFSRIAFCAANLGDEVALEMLRDIGRDTAASVIGAARRLDFSGENEIDVIMAGSVYVKGENPAMVETFKQEVCRHVGKRARFVLLQVPPVTGAVLWAIEEINNGLDLDVHDKVILSLTNS